MVSMNNSKIPRQVLEWDYKCRTSGWLRDLLKVCRNSGLPIPDEIRFGPCKEKDDSTES